MSFGFRERSEHDHEFSSGDGVFTSRDSRNHTRLAASLFVLGTMASLWTCPLVLAQVDAPQLKSVTTAAPPGTKVRKQAKPGEVTIDENIKAAFRIEPVVHRFEGKKGESIPFEFTITSQDEATDIEIRTVALRQEDNGVIMPDVDSPAPKAVTFEGPAAMTLKAETPYKLKGIVRVPNTQTTFHSFGLLVTDKGRRTPGTPASKTPANQAQIGIEFVTRYLLRCDINMEGVRPADAHKLVIESGILHEVDGRPQARVFISNPTASPLEFEMKARLVGTAGGTVGKDFNLVMPVRSTLEPPDRFVARLLPGSRIRMEEFIPFAVFSGDYKLETTLTVHGRKLVSNEFPIHAGESDYPAQAASVAQIMAGVSASPAQAELSLQRGGDRFVSVVVSNQSKEAYSVVATPRQRDQKPADWFLVRPQEFSLPAGASRKVLISLPPNRDSDTGHQYGHLHFAMTSTESGEEKGGGTIDVGLLSRTDVKPELNLGNLGFDGSGSQPAVILPITNKGQVHFPLNARMSLSDAEGHRVRFTAGYGRWLLPGDTTQVRFRMKDPIPAGRYTLRIQLDTKEGSAPIEITAPVQLTQ